MISVVVPVYNEESIVDELAQRTLSALKSIGEPFEIIIVDDGSSDNTLEKLLNHHKIDNRIKIIELSRNFGHQAAFTAGLKRSVGEFTVMMDGDLQDAPELIPEMYKTMISGKYDVVNGYRTSRAEKGIKGLLFAVFHKFFALTLSERDVENIGNFSMLDPAALEAMKQLREKTRYLPGLRNYVGFKQGTLDYRQGGAKTGETQDAF
ncbi:MAG: glycosyltransferase family 2 protein [Cyclobacteriaceae bacterium]|nr:glycosyltransferase family 2 protein [Cyclobacteriaceae bacterium]